MIDRRRLAALLLPISAVALAACDAAHAPAPSGDPSPANEGSDSAPPPPGDAASADGVNDGTPDITE